MAPWSDGDAITEPPTCETATPAFRNHMRRVLEHVEAGEVITITVDGRLVARRMPVTHSSVDPA